MDFGLTSFKQSTLGQKIGTVLAASQTREDMRVLSRYGFPAAMALGRPLQALNEAWPDADKKLVGRWIKEVMAEEGMAPILKARRVPPGYLFSVGAVYGPVQP